MNGITNKILSKQIKGDAVSEITSNDLDGSLKVWAQWAERRHLSGFIWSSEP